jgi:hypothetical protein
MRLLSIEVEGEVVDTAGSFSGKPEPLPIRSGGADRQGLYGEWTGDPAHVDADIQISRYPG